MTNETLAEPGIGAVPETDSRTMPSLPRLSVLWLASNLFWSAVMSQVLAQRVEYFVGDAKKGTYLAMIGAAGALMSTLIQLVIGPLSDNSTHAKGRRFVFVFWGVLLNTIPIFLFALSRSFWQLMFSFVLIQLLLNTATGPFQAIIPDRVPREHQGKASGWMGVWQLIGQIFGLILPGVLLTASLVNAITGRNMPDAQAVNFGVFLICTICASVLLICLFINAPLLIQPRFQSQKVQSLGGALRDAFDLDLKSHPDFAWLLVSRAVINMGIYAAINFLYYYVKDELSPSLPPRMPIPIAVMIIALAVTAGGVISTLIAGKLADKVSKRVVIYWSCGFAALAALGFCLAHNFIWACVIGLVFGIGYGAFCAVDWAFAANLMPAGREGKYMAIFHIAFTAPQVVGLMLGGLIGQQFGYRAVFLSVPFYLIVGAILISRVRERHEIEREAAAEHGKTVVSTHSDAS
jgi:MFS family permease